MGGSGVNEGDTFIVQDMHEPLTQSLRLLGIWMCEHDIDVVAFLFTAPIPVTFSSARAALH